jgi:hypothetical protein
MADEKNLLGMIGMCRGAGKAIIGVPMICEQLRKRNGRNRREDGDVNFLVIEASDTSDNTHKKITDKCIYYNVKHIRIASTCEILGKAVGKSAVGAVALADRNFCRAVLGKLEQN